MKFFRKPLINAAIILIVSIFYALIFILTSGHMEFERILTHADTLNSPFWNTWSAFLKQGKLIFHFSETSQETACMVL